MKILNCLILLFSLSVFAQDDESISWKEARISDKIEMTLSKADFDKRYKQADSIVASQPGETCALDEEAVKMLHYKGIKFEMSNGMLNFRSVDFSKRKGTYFSISDNWFDHTTTLKSFIKTYPYSSEYIADETTPDGDIMDMITILPKDASDEFEWRFYFNNGKLHSIECWQYCE
jgi:hypothetical protein